MGITFVHQPADQRFHFQPRATNPELWRTTVPLVVRERCRRHKGLIATWAAIHWLIVLHAASGRAHFGTREIAEEAGVGRNELPGPRGYIQRLVDLGLLQVVGHKSFHNLREPCPIYHIDLAELERLSLELVPDLLRERNIARPPPAVPDPRQLQMALFASNDPAPTPVGGHSPTHPSGTGDGGGHLPGHQPGQPWPVFGPDPGAAQERTLAQMTVAGPPAHRNGAGARLEAPAPRQAVPETGPEPIRFRQAVPETGPEAPETGPEKLVPQQAVPETGPEAPETGPEPPGIGQGMLETGPEHARNRDVEGSIGTIEKNEGVIRTPAPAFFQSLAEQAAQAVLATLQAQGSPHILNVPAILDRIPTAPNNAPPLSATVLQLWRGDQTALRSRDLHQLALLAGEYDQTTEGHGAYWLGRAILMADLCLASRDQPITITYLRGMLRRWREENSWGSDRELVELAPRRQLELVPAVRAEPESRRPIDPPPSARAELAPRQPLELVPAAAPETGPGRPAELAPVAAPETGPGRPAELAPAVAPETEPGRPAELAPPTVRAEPEPRQPLVIPVPSSYEDEAYKQALDHPAVQAYIEAFREQPSAFQAREIADVISDMSIWREVLKQWLLNNWNERRIGNMIDRYSKMMPQPIDGSDLPSVWTIHKHPRIPNEERERWVMRYHYAKTIEGQRAVLAQVEREYPPPAPQN